MSTIGRELVRPVETENSSIHRQPVGRKFPTFQGPPTDKFGPFIRKWTATRKEKWPERTSRTSGKRTKMAAQLQLASNDVCGQPHSSISLSPFSGPLSVSCHNIFSFFFKFQSWRATWPEARAACLCAGSEKSGELAQRVNIHEHRSSVYFHAVPCFVRWRPLAVNQTIVQTSAHNFGAIFSFSN